MDNNEAVQDREHDHRGSLSWHRLTPGHWTSDLRGGGYVLRKNPSGSWRVLHQGKLLDASAPRLATAQAYCQDHHRRRPAAVVQGPRHEEIPVEAAQGQRRPRGTRMARCRHPVREVRQTSHAERLVDTGELALFTYRCTRCGATRAVAEFYPAAGGGILLPARWRRATVL